MRSIFIAGAMASAFMPTESSARSYELIHEDSGDKYFINPQTYKRSGEKILVWIKKTYAKPSPRGVVSSESFEMFDCDFKASKIVKIIFYKADGSVSSSHSEQPVVYNAPDSVFYSFIEKLCAKS